jgi:hypothetical protein
MKKKTKAKNFETTFVELADELRVKLHEIDQKLEHLIKTYRRWHTSASDSPFDEFVS